MTAHIRPAEPTDVAGIGALWDECFAESMMVPLWELSGDRFDTTLVAVENDRVLGTVATVNQHVYDREGTPTPVLGLANVAVTSSARGRGLSQALVNSAVHTKSQSGCAFALLFTETPRVYEGASFRTFTQRRRSSGLLRSATSSIAANDSAVHVEPIAQADLAPLACLRERRPLARVRDQHAWERTRLWYRDATVLTSDRAYLIERHGRPHGEMGGAEAAVLEAGCSADGEDDLHLLAVLAAARWRLDGVTRVEVDLPADGVFGSIARHLLGDPRREADTTGMFRAVGWSSDGVRGLCEAEDAFHWTGDYL